jgi:hypothetical protein
MPHGKPRDPRKEEHGRRLIEHWRGSGQSVRAFGERHRLAGPSFYPWRRRLQQPDRLAPASQAPDPVTFLPAHVRHDPPDQRPPPPPPDPGESAKPRRKRHGRQQLPRHLPRDRRVYELSEAERLCQGGGQTRVVIGRR